MIRPECAVSFLSLISPETMLGRRDTLQLYRFIGYAFMLLTFVQCHQVASWLLSALRLSLWPGLFISLQMNASSTADSDVRERYAGDSWYPYKDSVNSKKNKRTDGHLRAQKRSAKNFPVQLRKL